MHRYKYSWMWSNLVLTLKKPSKSLAVIHTTFQILPILTTISRLSCGLKVAFRPLFLTTSDSAIITLNHYLIGGKGLVFTEWSNAIHQPGYYKVVLIHAVKPMPLVINWISKKRPQKSILARSRLEVLRPAAPLKVLRWAPLSLPLQHCPLFYRIRNRSLLPCPAQYNIPSRRRKPAKPLVLPAICVQTGRNPSPA